MPQDFGVGTSMLDTFDRANENPLSGGGNWATLDNVFTSVMQISSNVAVSTSGQAASYWTRSQFTDCAASITVTNVAASSASVFARCQGVGGTSTADGYRLQCSTGLMFLTTFTNGPNTSIRSLSIRVPLLTDGDQIGIQCIGTTIQGWLFHGGTWLLSGSFTDSTYSSGFLGIGSQSATQGAADFIGGPVGAPVDGFEVHSHGWGAA